ncbi:ABC transporter substrate-binding protein [Streptomyces sp. DSM 44915]|uniref:ABC transporter substrate-binding protein n=1 Tax=Streptomyces chisholmiae TaxID=3075540 RepID=A0ABU2JQN2_9ACTN|nr:ABC transporter substrate-binding protein [Streptomyces sp. DSM 44915]MDT0267297.1 ABC transporter substrate-binding protein [Streptomyces sp. DSM 44915]
MTPSRPRPRLRLPRAALAATATALLTLSACGSGVSDPADPADDPAAEGTTEQAGTTFTNCGREVTLDATPRAVVGLSPAQTELLLRLGIGDRLVGQAQTATAPLPDDLRDQAADIPVLSEDAPPNREVLLEAAPDLVTAPTAYEFSAEAGFAGLDQLEQAGAAAYIATGGCAERRMTATVDDLFTDLETLGRILDVEDAATEVAATQRAALDEVDARVADRSPVSVAQVYVEGERLSAVGAGVEYDIVRRAGGANVFGPEDAAFADFFAAEINPEELANRDPAVLVFGVHDEAHEQATRDYLTRTFPDLAAVRDDRLVAVSSADLFPGTIGNVRAVTAIADGLHPEAS